MIQGINLTGAGLFNPDIGLSAPVLTSQQTATGGGMMDYSKGLNNMLGAVDQTGLLSSVISSVVGDNLEIVQKYGIKAWGSSTTPEKARAYFMERVPPMIDGLIQSITPQNIADKLKEMSMILWHSQKLYEHKSTAHFRSGPSHEGALVHIDMSKKLRSETLDKIVSDLKARGVIISEKYAEARDNEFGSMPLGGGDKSLHGDSPLRYPYWIVDITKLQADKVEYQKDNQGNLVPKPKQHFSFGLFGLLLMGGLAWKYGLKKFR